MSDEYKKGYEDAIQKAVQVIKGFNPYTPYIVGQMKIDERKEDLIGQLLGLLK